MLVMLILLVASGGELREPAGFAEAVVVRHEDAGGGERQWWSRWQDAPSSGKFWADGVAVDGNVESSRW